MEIVKFLTIFVVILIGFALWIYWMKFGDYLADNYSLHLGFALQFGVPLFIVVTLALIIN